jgi:hypothetical protein
MPGHFALFILHQILKKYNQLLSKNNRIFLHKDGQWKNRNKPKFEIVFGMYSYTTKYHVDGKNSNQ